MLKHSWWENTKKAFSFGLDSKIFNIITSLPFAWRQCPTIEEKKTHTKITWFLSIFQLPNFLNFKSNVGTWISLEIWSWAFLFENEHSQSVIFIAGQRKAWHQKRKMFNLLIYTTTIFVISTPFNNGKCTTLNKWRISLHTFTVKTHTSILAVTGPWALGTAVTKTN